MKRKYEDLSPDDINKYFKRTEEHSLFVILPFIPQGEDSVLNMLSSTTTDRIPVLKVEENFCMMCYSKMGPVVRLCVCGTLVCSIECANDARLFFEKTKKCLLNRRGCFGDLSEISGQEYNKPLTPEEKELVTDIIKTFFKKKIYNITYINIILLLLVYVIVPMIGIYNTCLDLSRTIPFQISLWLSIVVFYGPVLVFYIKYGRYLE